MSDNPHKARKQMRLLLVVFALIIGALLASPYAHHTATNRQRKIENLFLKQPPPGPETPLADVTFVSFDTETTGVNPNYERIVEIAAVKFRRGQILEQASWLVNPEKFIPETAQEIHGITPEMVADQLTFKEVYQEFAAFIAGAILTAHNANFDVQFVRMEAQRAGLPAPPNPVFDSLRLFRKLFPDLDSYALETLAEHVKIDTGEFHRAEDDAVYVAAILNHVLDHDRPAETLEELLELSGGTYEF